jgi:hypothetical protein
MLRMKAGLALTSASSKAGIRRIDALGEPFDPDRHEAVFEVADAERPAGTVAEALQPGYSGGLRRRSMDPAPVTKPHPASQRSPCAMPTASSTSSAMKPTSAKARARPQDSASSRGRQQAATFSRQLRWLKQLNPAARPCLERL